MGVRILNCVKDTYITNKIRDSKFKVEDANVGQAGTISLFVLANENSFLSGSTRITGSNEFSRGLLKFDYAPIQDLTGSVLNLNNFSASLLLTRVESGLPVPQNSSVECFLLSRSWDEGLGRDEIAFNDLGEANFITASFDTTTSQTDLWALSGSGEPGFVGTTKNIDFFTGSMDLGDLTGSQTLSLGTEDINMDITKLVSASLTNSLIGNEGFLLTFPSASVEGNKTLFVLRYATRHATNPQIRPRILVRWSEEIQDHRRSFFFSTSGSIFLHNTTRGQPTNIKSGSTLITGSNSILVKLESGSYKEYFTGSQHQTVPGTFLTGTYSASFGIDEFHPTLRSEILSAGSASFDEVWEQLDNTLIFSASEKLIIKSITPNTFNKTPSNIQISITNMRQSYQTTEVPRFRIEAFETSPDGIKASKLPFKRKSLIFTKCYYRVRDAYNNDILIPFDADGNNEVNATLCSTDSEGMYFDAHWVQDLSPGRVYQIDLMIKDLGVIQIFDRLDTKFKIE